MSSVFKIDLEDGKIHTCYVQDLTQTGRLSSVDPNLQKHSCPFGTRSSYSQGLCPRRGKQCLAEFDHSQIELRVLAHISGDEHLIDAFKHGADIHTSLCASSILKKPEDDAEWIGEMPKQ